MAAPETKAWLKGELVSALGFAEVDEIVAYITSTFYSKQEASSYLVELLGIPAGRAEHISTRLFSPEPSAVNPRRVGVKGGEAAAAQGKEGLVPRPTGVNSRLKPSKKNKKGTGKAAALLNNALIINCLRCGRIEYNGARRCAFCDTELCYEADVVMTDQAAQQHMEELVRLDKTGAERTRVLDMEQYFYDDEQVEKNEGDDHSTGSRTRHPIKMALDLNNRQFVDVKITRNEQLAKDARELVDGVQRKMSKGKRGKGSFHQPTESSPSSAVVQMQVAAARRRLHKDDKLVDVSAGSSVSLNSVGYRDAPQPPTPFPDLSVPWHDTFQRAPSLSRLERPRPTTPAVYPAMSTTISAAKGLNTLQRRVTAAESSSQCSAPANPFWDFYASGLVDENDDCSDGEDTEDELETQDWILFQRQRAQARLANACQREARVMRTSQH